MENDEILKLIANKMEQDINKITITYFELKVKRNLSNAAMLDAVHVMADYLEKNGYKIYRTNQNYIYEGKQKKVEINELLVGIKNSF